MRPLLLAGVYLLLGARFATTSLGAEAPGRWVLVKSPTGSSLRGVSVVDRNTIWASGAKGTVVRSTDGGQRFTVVKVPDNVENDFRDIHAFADRRVSLMTAGKPPRIHFSDDGGESWSLAFEHPEKEAFLDALAFWDQRRGIAFGDPIKGRLLIVSTRDGGRSWQELPRDRQPQTAEGEHGYAASGTCLAVAPKGHVWIGLGGHPPDSNDARVLVSQDFGLTWTSNTCGLKGDKSAGVFSLHLFDDRRAVAVGGDFLKPELNRGVVSLGEGGGGKWTRPADHGLRGYRSCVAAARVNGKRTLIACGPTGSDWSGDDGRTWRPLGDDGFHAIGFSNDGKYGWAVGAGGRMAKWAPHRD